MLDYRRTGCLVYREDRVHDTSSDKRWFGLFKDSTGLPCALPPQKHVQEITAMGGSGGKLPEKESRSQIGARGPMQGLPPTRALGNHPGQIQGTPRNK